MKKTLFIALAALMTTSCTKTFYQVCKVEAPELQEKQNSLVYENEDCIVSYNLWGEKGNIAFWVMNKTDKDLFINLDRTFFIKNGVAYNYFLDREWQTGKSTSTSTSTTSSFSYAEGAGASATGALWGNIYSASAALSRGISFSSTKKRTNTTSSSVTTKEERMVCIPPHASKLISEYSISGKTQLQCNKKVDYPSRESTPTKYQQENSPLQFSNRIAYTTDASCKDVKFMTHDFWVSEIINYSQKAAFVTEKEKSCYGNTPKTHQSFKMASPRKYYNVTNTKKMF